jgi:ankyrin repeat protein
VLLKYGASVNSIDRLGRTLLHLAADHNMIQLSEALIFQGISVMTRDFNNQLPLHAAIAKDNAEVLQILVFFPISLIFTQ